MPIERATFLKVLVSRHNESSELATSKSPSPDTPWSPPASRSRYRPVIALTYWPLVVTSLVGLTLCFMLGQARHEQDRAQEHSRLLQDLSTVRARLEATAQATFGPTLSLEAMIQLDGGITPERFNALSQRVITLLPQVRNIVAAPDDVARFVYPVTGNESVINLQYRSIPIQYAQIQLARSQGRALLVAPVKLVQGGIGIIQRTPVFLPQLDGTAPAYWGVVSVVSDLGKFIQAAGLTEHPRLTLALYQWDEEQHKKGSLVWGDPATQDRDNSAQEFVHLPGATWILLGAPQAQPNLFSDWLGVEVMAGLLATAALTGLAGVVVHRRRQLQAKNRRLSRQIEESQRNQRATKVAEERFRSLTELSADWVWEQDAQYRFVYYSRDNVGATGSFSPRILGLRRWESPEADPHIDWTDHIAQVERHEPFRNFEYSQISAKGELRHVSISGEPLFDDLGQFAGYRGTGRDITDTKLAELALRKSEATLQLTKDRLQAVLDSAREVSIIVTDLNGRIVLFNRGAELMLGYAESELLGQSVARIHVKEELQSWGAQLNPADDGLTFDIDAFMAQKFEHDTVTSAWRYVRKDGHHLNVSLTTSLMRGRNGKPSGWLAIARDVSAQRQAQRDLERLNVELETRVENRTSELQQTLTALRHTQDDLLRAEKMAALGSLVAGIAHELNTPLGNCLTTASTLEGMTQQIRKHFDSGQMRKSVLQSYLDDARLACSILLRSMSTATELVTHFKQISVDQTTAQRRDFKLQSVVDDVLVLLRTPLRKAGVTVSVEIGVVDKLDSYPGPLGQVLTNLIMNAIMHAFEPLDVADTEPVESPDRHILIRALPAGPALPGSHPSFTLILEDNGQGMTYEVTRRAFDPFFTTKMGQGGTGLGLNIVYNIVTGILGGLVDLHSEPGQGARFTLNLPYVAPDHSAHNTGVDGLRSR
ncbi:PAS domain S-box protein [Roseateles koreensis]|uniref:histidine kinase n=1 Tax=Roseateles koreensis TaxID=2987526 RepID=A0ABT5KX30_9BURK|nr:PAS domain S-box protein [Roseateles koreensis]MDC8786908.1 PAS domain S-box protein [Roseateles koreensis]